MIYVISSVRIRRIHLLGNQEIIPLYDYVHLQKGIRNNLLTKDLLMNKYKKEPEKQYASWNDIIVTYKMDKYSFLRQWQMPKLNDRHIFADRIPKMKVKYATQVLSHTIANFIDLVITWNKSIVKTTKGDMHLPSSAAITSDVFCFLTIYLILSTEKKIKKFQYYYFLK